MATIRGGSGLERHLGRIADQLAKGSAVRMGFLEDATYPAAMKNARRLMKGLDVLNSGGPMKPGAKPRNLRNYNKRRKAFMGPPAPAPTLHVAQVAWWMNFGNARVPPRPFFTNMIAHESPTWGRQLGAALVAAKYDGRKALTVMGTAMKDALVKSIVDWPADNAPLTVAIKGFNKGLIDSGVMQRAPDFEVTE